MGFARPNSMIWCGRILRGQMTGEGLAWKVTVKDTNLYSRILGMNESRPVVMLHWTWRTVEGMSLSTIALASDGAARAAVANRLAGPMSSPGGRRSTPARSRPSSMPGCSHGVSAARMLPVDATWPSPWTLGPQVLPSAPPWPVPLEGPAQKCVPLWPEHLRAQNCGVVP